MENKDRTLRTEKELEIAKLEFQLATMIDVKESAKKNKLTYEQQIFVCERVIKATENELVALITEKPKLSAKDFPCLDYYANRVTFNDGKNMYTITEEFKQIIRSARATEEIIDENVEIVECQLSEIKEGDYFCWDEKNSEDIDDYYYCTEICPENTFPIQVLTINEDCLFEENCLENNGTVPCYKFILRNR